MSNETERTLHELKLPGMASCWSSLEETHQLDKLTLREGMQIMLQYERDTRGNNRIQRLIKNAGFRLRASMEELETDTARGIQACSAADLATGNYITGGMTVIITGPAGTGKSYFACALGDRACRNGRKVLYFTMNMLIENLKLAHLEGRETNFFRKLNAHDLLIIDDFGMVKLYYLSMRLGLIYHQCRHKDVALTRLARWYDEVDKSGFLAFGRVARSIQTHYLEVINFFEKRSTNAASESFNAKIKNFRAQFRGVKDKAFFLYRLTKIYA